MLLRVIDIETTGQAPPAEVIEFGRVDVEHDAASTTIRKQQSRLYKPLRGIPVETMAVHHITPANIPDDAPVCTPDRLRLAVWGGTTPDVLVAHNADFERLFITEAASDTLPWICTYRVALRLWPQAPRHSNQVLRYWRGLEIDAAEAMPPHRAGPDALVTAHLVLDMLKETSVDQMVAWTREPKSFPSPPFGKHKGTRWPDVPADYLDWLVRQDAMEADVKSCARRERERRCGQIPPRTGSGGRFGGRRGGAASTVR